MRCSSILDFVRELAHTGDGVCAVDQHHRIVLWNQAAESLLNYSVKQVMGKPCQEVIRARDCKYRMICGPKCYYFEKAKQFFWPAPRNIVACSGRENAVRLNMSTLAILGDQGNLSVLVHTLRSVGGDQRSDFNAQLPPKPSSLSSSIDELVLWEDVKANGVGLSKQEVKVLRLVSEGFRTSEIASRFSISPITVRNHMQHILKNLGVHNRAAAVFAALRCRLL